MNKSFDKIQTTILRNWFGVSGRPYLLAHQLNKKGDYLLISYKMGGPSYDEDLIGEYTVKCVINDIPSYVPKEFDDTKIKSIIKEHFYKHY